MLYCKQCSRVRSWRKQSDNAVTHQIRLMQSEVNIYLRAVLAHLTLCIQTVLVFKGRKGLRLPNSAAGTTLALVFGVKADRRGVCTADSVFEA